MATWRYLLLIDVVVPDEGPALADQVQTASPTTKILLMSGYHASIVRCVVPQRDTKPYATRQVQAAWTKVQ